MENPARYIIRASFSQERMSYVKQTGQVVYQSKDGQRKKVFDALEWPAAITSHIPNKGEQMVRNYGYYSNVSRGRRKRASTHELIPTILEPVLTSKAFRKTWARLIQRIYPVKFLTGSLYSTGVYEDDYLIDSDFPLEAYL